METFLYVLSCAILIGVFFLMMWCLYKHQQNKNFQRFLRPGMFAFYYEEEDRISCQIKQVNGQRVVILNQYGEEIDIDRHELYV